MKFARYWWLSLLVLGVAACEHEVVFPEKPDSAQALQSTRRYVPDEYVVQLQPGSDAASLSQALAVPGRDSVQKVFSVQRGRYRGFQIHTDSAGAEALRRDPRVKRVDQDEIIYPTGTQTHAPWQMDVLDFLTASPWTFDSSYTYTYDGTGVWLYIVDTGILPNHVEFTGRMKPGYDATGAGWTGDCYGHGTAAASAAGGTKSGMAKDAWIVPVRVSNNCSNGSEYASDILDGLTWAANQTPTGRKVINASLGLYQANGGPGGLFLQMEEVLNDALANNDVVVHSAGNEGLDACNFGPRVPQGITVSGFDASADWSGQNGGACVTVLAPGTNLWLANSTGTSGFSSWSGTSFAGPIAAGWAAIYLEGHSTHTPGWVKSAIQTNAINIFGDITGIPANTVNLRISKNTAPGAVLIITGTTTLPSCNPFGCFPGQAGGHWAIHPSPSSHTFNGTNTWVKGCGTNYVVLPNNPYGAQDSININRTNTNLPKDVWIGAITIDQTTGAQASGYIWVNDPDTGWDDPFPPSPNPDCIKPWL